MTSWIFPTTLVVLASLAYIEANRTTCSLDTQPCLLDEQSSCQSGRCKCDPGYKGVGELRCVPEGRYTCTILNDPRGTPFSGGKSADIALPCRYLATDVTVRKRETGFWCRSRIYAYGWRFKGKIFLIGYDIRLDWNGNNIARYTLSLKAYGKKKNDGTYDWDLLTRHSRYLGGDQWQRADIGLTAMDTALGGINFFGVDEANNRVQFYSSVCGIDTAFRLPDPNAGVDQPDLPGLFIAVNPDAGNVVFTDVPGSVCLTPSISAEDAAASVDPSLSLDDAFLYKVAAHDRGQSFPSGDTLQCTNLEQVAASCNNPEYRKNALERCSFILQAPRFLNCYSEVDNSGDAVQFFKECMDAFCNNDATKCTQAKNKVNDNPECLDKSPDAATLANDSCSSLLVS